MKSSRLDGNARDQTGQSISTVAERDEQLPTNQPEDHFLKSLENFEKTLETPGFSGELTDWSLKQ